MLVPKDGLRSIFVAWGKRGGTHNSTIFCIIPLDAMLKLNCRGITIYFICADEQQNRETKIIRQTKNHEGILKTSHSYSRNERIVFSNYLISRETKHNILRSCTYPLLIY